MNSNWFNKITTFTIGWFISLLLWKSIRKTGINEYLDYTDINVSYLYTFASIVTISLFAGVFFGSIQYYQEKYLTRKTSFRSLLITSLTLHVFTMVFIYLTLYIILRIIGLDKNIQFIDFLTSPLTITNLIYSILVNSSIVILIQVNRLLGKGYLGKLITGKFYEPKEELRAFMFLDLKGSTTIAESLGHIKYSRFIQDCFSDLLVVEKHKAEVYQYVGDEVVLTWKIKKNDTIVHCLKAYFSYANCLETKSDYYKSNYNIVPFFKAGMHIGLITAVEVGELKREIAYHGDTINIASRIQEQCKIYNQKFLISDSVVAYIQKSDLFSFTKMGEETLRGKKKPVTIYSVAKSL
ncbi:MAG: adenylate cyclase [Flavobacteriaceae bacterium]|nr:MAG: adenylate cyclase [Flavobacteriaceae bacterium]